MRAMAVSKPELKFVSRGVVPRAWQVALGALVLIAGCAQQPPYFGPKDSDHATGYTDERLDQNRYRVTYTGNSATARETVEDFLLLRSAQVTLQSGFGHFVFDTRDTQAHTTYYSDFMGWPGWRRHGWYWNIWPYDDEAETRPVTRYQAYAEIVMLTDAQAAKEPRSIDAQSIMQRLGPAATPPPPPAK
jgi:hypothetical protein